MKHKDGSFKVNISDKKDEEDIILVSKQPIHPREIIKKKAKLLEFDAKTLKEIPYINIDVPIDTKESENEMTNRMIQNLPANNDSYYIDHEEGSNTFPIKEDPLQRGKKQLLSTYFKRNDFIPGSRVLKFKF